MDFKEKKEHITCIDESILLADGFEDALVGYGEQFNKTFAVYDRSKCIQILIDRDKMTFEEAVEYFDFNVTGAYVGEHTPAFVTFFEDDTMKECQPDGSKAH